MIPSKEDQSQKQHLLNIQRQIGLLVKFIYLSKINLKSIPNEINYLDAFHSQSFAIGEASSVIRQTCLLLFYLLTFYPSMASSKRVWLSAWSSVSRSSRRPWDLRRWGTSCRRVWGRLRLPSRSQNPAIFFEMHDWANFASRAVFQPLASQTRTATSKSQVIPTSALPLAADNNNGHWYSLPQKLR